MKNDGKASGKSSDKGLGAHGGARRPRPASHRTWGASTETEATVQGLPLPQPEGGRRRIVLTVDEVLLLDGSARIAATLKL